jgi:hypothetical protein
MHPHARQDGLTVRQMPDETLVYDHRRHKAHCLNGAAALVWRHCDGHTTVAQLAEILQRALPGPITEAVVRLALQELAEADLLQPGEGGPVWGQLCSRRDVMRKLGLAALAAPAVLSITAPRASAQGSVVTTTTGVTTTGVTTTGTTTTGVTTTGVTTTGVTTTGVTTTGVTTTGVTTTGVTTTGVTTTGTTTTGTTTTGTTGTFTGTTTAATTAASTAGGTTGFIQ